MACGDFLVDKSFVPLLSVKVISRAKSNEVIERHGQLVVRVTAAPTDGKANAAVLKVLAKHLKVSASQLTVVRGATASRKTIRVD